MISVDKVIKKLFIRQRTQHKTNTTQLLRGAKSEDKKRLNKLGGKILRDAGLDFDKSKDYDFIKSNNLPEGSTFDGACYHVGYAGYYLYKMMYEADACCLCRIFCKTKGADPSRYRKLVDIDTDLGTKASDQLYVCLTLKSKPEFIKVRIYYFLNHSPSQI